VAEKDVVVVLMVNGSNAKDRLSQKELQRALRDAGVSFSATWAYKEGISQLFGPTLQALAMLRT
jgi:hypothetical protein